MDWGPQLVEFIDGSILMGEQALISRKSMIENKADMKLFPFKICPIPQILLLKDLLPVILSLFLTITIPIHTVMFKRKSNLM